MNLTFVKVIVVAGILFLNLKTGYAEENLKYELTQDKVERACVSWTPDWKHKWHYDVNVVLNESNKKSFSQFTGDNIGKKVDVIFLGRILESVTNRAKMENGTLLAGEFDSEEDARIIVDVLDPEHKGEKFETERFTDEFIHSNKKRIAWLIYTYASTPPRKYDILKLYKLLDNKGTVLKNDPVYSSANIQVRDIAFVCIEEITGVDFSGDYKGKEIITYFSKEGTPYRYTIPSFTDDKYKEIKNNIKYWISGFKQGTAEGADSSPRSE